MRISDWSSDVCSSDLPEQIEEMRHTWHQLTPGEEVTCPKCQHEFVPGRPEGLVEPEWSLAELKAQEQMHTRWADPLDEVLKPDVIVEDVEKERLAHAQAERRRELEEQVAVYAEPARSEEAIGRESCRGRVGQTV